MSGQQSLQPSAPRGEQVEGVVDVLGGARDLSHYPLRLFAAHMAEIYGVGLKRFYQLAAEGAFDFAVIYPEVGRMSWSRERVQQHLACELRVLTPVRKRA